MSRLARLAAVFWSIAVAFETSTAFAADDASFYKGRTLTVLIGHPPGGGYDIYARVFARHFGRYVDGHPNVVPQNLTGAGGLKAANQLYNVSPRDGSVLAVFSSSAAFEPLVGGAAAKFDTTKFTWIGNMDENVSTCGVWYQSGIKSFDDLLSAEALFGGSGATAITTQHALALKNLVGAKIKLIQGYEGSPEINLAMQRGEVQGGCGMALSTLRSQYDADWKAGRLIPVIQLGIEKHPDLTGVAHVYDYAKTDADRQALDLVFGRNMIGRPVAGPPELPLSRSDALRRAFMDTMSDQQFLADAAKAKIDITPVAGDQLDRLVRKFFSYPKSAIDRAEAAVTER